MGSHSLLLPHQVYDFPMQQQPIDAEISQIFNNPPLKNRISVFSYRITKSDPSQHEFLYEGYGAMEKKLVLTKCQMFCSTSRFVDFLFTRPYVFNLFCMRCGDF